MDKVTGTYDALGRQSSTTTNMGGTARTLGHRYHPGLMPRYYLNWPDGLSYRFGYDNLNRNTFGIDAAGVTVFATAFITIC